MAVVHERQEPDTGQTGQAPDNAQPNDQAAAAGSQAANANQGQQSAAADTPAASPNAATAAAATPNGATPAAAQSNSPASNAAAAAAASTPNAQSAQPSAQAAAATSQGVVPFAASPPPLTGEVQGPTDANAGPTITGTFVPSDPSAFVSSSASKGGIKKMSGGAIGGMVGGIVGGLAFIIIVFALWRNRRGRGEKIAPPPPRDISEYRPPTFHSRSGSAHMSPRTSTYSYANLNATGRPPSSYNPYYASYPVATPSSSLPSHSPPMAASAVPSGSPSLASTGTATNGTSTPAAALTGGGLHRDGSTTSSGSASTDTDIPPADTSSRLPHALSMDHLRPATPQPSDGDSRTGSDSPRSSTLGLPRMPRHGSRASMGSLNGSFKSGPPGSPVRSVSGAPHRGRPLMLTMPRPLSVASTGSDTPQPIPSPRASLRHSSYYGRAPSMSSRHSMPFGEFATAPSSPTSAQSMRAHQRFSSPQFQERSVHDMV